MPRTANTHKKAFIAKHASWFPNLYLGNVVYVNPLQRLDHYVTVLL